MNKPVLKGFERASFEMNKLAKTRSETNTPDQTGFETNKPDQTGFETNTPDQTGFETNTPDQTGLEKCKPDQTGFEKGEPDQTGFEVSRPVQTGSERKVAIKVFAASQKKAFLEEREVYELARLANPPVTSSILQYFGSAEDLCISGIVCVIILNLNKRISVECCDLSLLRERQMRT